MASDIEKAEEKRTQLRRAALDLARCPVSGAFTVADVRKAIAGHTLASAAITGVYTLNPAVQLP